MFVRAFVYISPTIIDDMNTMKRFLIALLLAVTPVVASAQVLEKAAKRMELVSVESEIGEAFTTELSVFQMDDDHSYWLSVGHPGIGRELVQLKFDPVYEMFIPLGDTLDDAIGTMKDLLDIYNKPRLYSTEVQGCLAAMYPDSEKLEPVSITSRRVLLTKILSFSVQRDDLVRSTFIDRADFSSLVTSLTLYRKIHPKE